MTRAEAITALGKFDALADLAGLVQTDTTPGYKSAIDSALRKLGFAQSELATADVDDEDVESYLALLDYYALKLLKINIAASVDLSVTAADGKIDKKRSQAFKMLEGLLADAAAEVSQLGYLSSDFEIVNFNTNYLEPDLEASL